MNNKVIPKISAHDDNVEFEDEVGEVIGNLIKITKRAKLKENVWRGLIGKDTYKLTVIMEDGQLTSLRIEKR